MDTLSREIHVADLQSNQLAKSDTQERQKEDYIPLSAKQVC